MVIYVDMQFSAFLITPLARREPHQAYPQSMGHLEGALPPKTSFGPLSRTNLTKDEG